MLSLHCGYWVVCHSLLVSFPHSLGWLKYLTCSNLWFNENFDLTHVILLTQILGRREESIYFLLKKEKENLTSQLIPDYSPSR